MTIRTPATDGQLTSGDPRGSSSCVSYAASYAVSHATHGRLSPTGQKIREWTADVSGGLELGQVDRAITAHTDLEPMTDLFGHDEFWDYVRHGWHAVLIGGEGPVESTRFCAQPGFVLNHAIWVPAMAKDGDPLADGRRRGIYKYVGESYGFGLTNDFAAALRLSNGRRAGTNHFEAMLIRSEPSPVDSSVPPEYEITLSKTDRLRVYEVDRPDKRILGWLNDVPYHHTGGLTARCTSRVRFRLKNGDTRYLVRLLSGAHGDAKLGSKKGWWVPTEAPYSHLRRLD